MTKNRQIIFKIYDGSKSPQRFYAEQNGARASVQGMDLELAISTAGLDSKPRR